MDLAMITRAQGCMLGQLAGDALGSQVEFRSAEDMAKSYPEGLRELRDGGTWNTIAGQPTDDSEMALLLARLLVRNSGYDSAKALEAYTFWLGSGPFDCGNTIRLALNGTRSTESQANGSMMRASPIGIFGACLPLDKVGMIGRSDATLTHPNEVCVEANALFTMAIATAISSEIQPVALYEKIMGWANSMNVPETLFRCVDDSVMAPPRADKANRGWVLIAFGNALYQLLHAETLEEAIVETVMRGGDTDTNAAIAGALLGAVHGRDGIPDRWTECLLNCRPAIGKRGVVHPRSEVFWPTDALELAEALLYAGKICSFSLERE